MWPLKVLINSLSDISKILFINFLHIATKYRLSIVVPVKTA
jgi:hypothetical protein